MFLATRRRLALWYTTVTAVLLLVFASGFFLYVRNTLIERVDDTLSHVVEVVQRSLVLETVTATTGQPTYQVNLEASFRPQAAAVEDDRIDLEWFDPTGKLLWSTFSEPLELPIHLSHRGEFCQSNPFCPGLDLELPIHPSHRGETVELDPEHWWRQMTERLEVEGQVLGYLRVSHPWFEVTKPSQQLILDLSLGISLMVGLVAAIGWFLSRLAIEPIRESYQQLKQFTADASHELRNPIALIQTNVQVALADPQPDPLELQRQLAVVERLTRRLGRLVDDLLFLTRQDSGMVQPQLQPCPLDALLMEVVTEQTAIAQAKQIQLRLNLQAPETTVVPGADTFTLAGDYDQLVRLFTNLVSNGIHYTPAGGEVHLSLQRCLRHGLSYLQVQIHDTGIGIPEAALPHLFDRFYRVDPGRTKDNTIQNPLTYTSTMGTGLGLAIARAIAENHQGQIRVESKLNQGTTFTVWLPQKAEG